MRHIGEKRNKIASHHYITPSPSRTPGYTMIYTPKKTTIHCFYSEIDRHRRPAILFSGTVTTAYRLRSRPLFGIIVSSHQNAQGRWILKVRAAFRKFGLAINEFPLWSSEFLKKFLQKKIWKIFLFSSSILRSIIFKKKNISYEDFCVVFLLFLFLSFTSKYRRFETSPPRLKFHLTDDHII